MGIFIGVAVGIAFAVFVTTFLAWYSVGRQIRTMSDRVKDYLLISPTSPGAKGVISVTLFEAMRDLCEAAKATGDTYTRWAAAKRNATALVADVDALYGEHAKAEKEFDAAVDRLRKVEGSHRSEQKRGKP